MSEHMKITTKEDWQFSIDVFQTADGPVARVTDGRMTLVGGEDAKKGMAAVAGLLSEAAAKLKAEAGN
jgi:hypothetical protein